MTSALVCYNCQSRYQGDGVYHQHAYVVLLEDHIQNPVSDVGKGRAERSETPDMA